ncbi:hypothetical protein ACFY9Q_07165 [Streptomyces sp. NPDC012389]|uniref:hypothetical protein n=1 Tax=Streptomyces sp. NPDC012389 TaxID=3364830 RepID=UPI0036E3CA77
MRRLLIPATVLALSASMGGTAHAIEEEPPGTAPEALEFDAVATRETGYGATAGPSLSSQQIAAERALDALPEPIGGGIGAQRCDNPYQKWISVSRKTDYHVPSRWNGTSFKDGPGGKMTVEVLKSGKIGVEVAAGAEAEAGAILAKAKATFGVKVVAEVSVSTGHKYEHSIPNGYYGHLQYGSWGHQVHWVKYETTPDRCGKRKLKSGTAKLPTKETGWRWWKTRT